MHGMIVLKNIYELNDTQRAWLYAELKRRKLMQDGQQLADMDAHQRRTELMHEQGIDPVVVRSTARQQQELANQEEVANSSGLDCCAMDTAICYAPASSSDDNDGMIMPDGCIYPDGGGCGMELEELLGQLMNESSASILEFLALD